MNNVGGVFVVSVSGEMGAMAYPVAAGNTVIAIDWNGGYFWIKSADANGLPHAMRKFKFEEETPKPQETEEMTSLKNEMAELKRMIAELKGVNKQ